MLDFGMFKELVGTKVAALSEAHGSVMLEITEAEQSPGDRPDNAFSVLFKGPLDAFLEQSTHQLTIGDHGDHAVFMVPINEHSDGYVYEAVFTAFKD